MVITSVVLYFSLRLPQVQSTESQHAAKRLEYPSAALLLVSVGVPLFALNLGGEVFAWSHPVIITMFCLTPVLISLFYYVDTHIALTPIVPRRFIHNRDVAIALACTLPMKFVFDQVCLHPWAIEHNILTQRSYGSVSERIWKRGHLVLSPPSATGR